MKEGSNAVRPIAATRVLSKSGIATFDEIQKTLVYISIAYDAIGKWTDLASDPPAGTSLRMYSKEPGILAPVDLDSGKTTKVCVELDDSYQKLSSERTERSSIDVLRGLKVTERPAAIN